VLRRLTVLLFFSDITVCILFYLIHVNDDDGGGGGGNLSEYYYEIYSLGRELNNCDTIAPLNCTVLSVSLSEA